MDIDPKSGALAVPEQVLAVMAVTVAAVCALCAHIPYKPPVHSKGHNSTIIFVGAGGGGEVRAAGRLDTVPFSALLNSLAQLALKQAAFHLSSPLSTGTKSFRFCHNQQKRNAHAAAMATAMVTTMAMTNGGTTWVGT